MQDELRVVVVFRVLRSCVFRLCTRMLLTRAADLGLEVAVVEVHGGAVRVSRVHHR